jgi:hypothetical protein
LPNGWDSLTTKNNQNKQNNKQLSEKTNYGLSVMIYFCYLYNNQLNAWGIPSFLSNNRVNILIFS